MSHILSIAILMPFLESSILMQFKIYLNL